MGIYGYSAFRINWSYRSSEDNFAYPANSQDHKNFFTYNYALPNLIIWSELSFKSYLRKFISLAVHNS
nr:hypothetical protein [Mycoplasmopsis bovis]